MSWHIKCDVRYFIANPCFHAAKINPKIIKNSQEDYRALPPLFFVLTENGCMHNIFSVMIKCYFSIVNQTIPLYEKSCVPDACHNYLPAGRCTGEEEPDN